MCRDEGLRVNSQAAKKSSYDCKGKGALRTMAGNNEVELLKGLLKGIKSFKDEVNQLHSEVKQDK